LRARTITIRSLPLCARPRPEDCRLPDRAMGLQFGRAQSGRVRDQTSLVAIVSKRLRPGRPASTKLSSDILCPIDKNFQRAHRSAHRRSLQPRDRFRSALPAFDATASATIALISKRAKPPTLQDKLHRSPRLLLRSQVLRFSSRAANSGPFLEADIFRRHQVSQSRLPSRRRSRANRDGRHRRDAAKQRRDRSGGSRFAR